MPTGTALNSSAKETVAHPTVTSIPSLNQHKQGGFTGEISGPFLSTSSQNKAVVVLGESKSLGASQPSTTQQCELAPHPKDTTKPSPLPQGPTYSSTNPALPGADQSPTTGHNQSFPPSIVHVSDQPLHPLQGPKQLHLPRKQAKLTNQSSGSKQLCSDDNTVQLSPSSKNTTQSSPTFPSPKTTTQPSQPPDNQNSPRDDLHLSPTPPPCSSLTSPCGYHPQSLDDNQLSPPYSPLSPA